MLKRNKTITTKHAKKNSLTPPPSTHTPNKRTKQQQQSNQMKHEDENICTLSTFPGQLPSSVGLRFNNFISPIERGGVSTGRLKRAS